MPVLTNPEQLELLRQVIGDRSDTAAIMSELNAPTVGESIVNSVSAEDANAILSFDTSCAIYDAGASSRSNALPGRSAAITWDRTLALGSISLAEGTQGRAVVDALVAVNIMATDERDTLIQLATTTLPGPSWAETVGIGHVYHENIEQALEAAV